MRPLQRIQPAGPVQAYKTYEIIAPKDTHWRAATCEEAGCIAQRDGWVMPIDEASELGADQAEYIRRRSGRSHSEERGKDGITYFRFPAGEECFIDHRLRVEREPIHVVRGGDWRGLVGRRHVYDRGDQWVDDFASHQERIERSLSG